MSFGFLPYFTEITRPGLEYGTAGSCIDNIFLKSENKGFESIKYMIPYPDHYPLLLSTPIKQIEPDVIHKQQTKIYYKQFISIVSIKGWQEIY